MDVIRTALVLLIAGSLSGCFLFGGDDDNDKGAMTSSMDGGGVNEASAVGSAPPSPWRSIELQEDSGSSGGGFLPVAALGISILSLGLVVVHWVRHRRPAAA